MLPINILMRKSRMVRLKSWINATNRSPIRTGCKERLVRRSGAWSLIFSHRKFYYILTFSNIKLR